MGSPDLPKGTFEDERTELEAQAKRAEEADKKARSKDKRSPEQKEADRKSAVRERRKTLAYLEQSEEGFRKMEERHKKEEAEFAFSAPNVKEMGEQILLQAAALTAMSVLGSPQNLGMRPVDVEAAQANPNAYNVDLQRAAMAAQAAYESGDYEWLVIDAQRGREATEKYAKELGDKIRTKVPTLSFAQLREMAGLIDKKGRENIDKLPVVLTPEQRRLEAILIVQQFNIPNMKILEDVGMELGLIHDRWPGKLLARSANRTKRLREAAMKGIELDKFRMDWSWDHVAHTLLPEGREPTQDEKKKRREAGERARNSMLKQGFSQVNVVMQEGLPNIFSFTYKDKIGRFVIMPGGMIEYWFHGGVNPSFQKKGRYSVEMYEAKNGRFRAGSLEDAVRMLKADINLPPKKREAMLEAGPRYIYATWPEELDPEKHLAAYMMYLVAEPLRVPDDALEGQYGIARLGSPYPVVSNFPMAEVTRYTSFGPLALSPRMRSPGAFPEPSGLPLPIGLTLPGYRKVFMDRTRYGGRFVPYKTPEEWGDVKADLDKKRDTL